MSAPSDPAFAFPSPAAALAALLEPLAALPPEPLALSAAAGRVLAQEVFTDRPSPPFDHSAVDGYALRAADLSRPSLPIVGEVRIGRQPPLFALGPEGGAIRIVTGAPIPAGAELVVMREHVREAEGRITLDPARLPPLRPGSNIRRTGENAPGGSPLARPGDLVTAPLAGALAAVGAAAPLVHRRVRVAILCTGDELVEPAAMPSPWQIRDSNGITLLALLAGHPWCSVERLPRTPDDPAALAAAISSALDSADALLLTGGVSMGDRDYVPGVLERLGARALFHKLPQRPGKPILAAIAPRGQPVLALPGNPVSVMVTARRFALPALRKLGGFGPSADPASRVTLINPDERTLDFYWHRLVTLDPVAHSSATLLSPKGSGDLIAAAGSQGFVEIPPGRFGAGPWPLFEWAGGAGS